jgi:hypothetical protein
VVRMRRCRATGIALLTMCALGAVIASAAQAESAPSFSIGGTRLVAGKTHNIAVRATANFMLVTTNSEIECTVIGTEKAVLLGSNPGEPGRDSEVVKLEGCALVGNGEECFLSPEAHGSKVTDTITTAPLRSEQVERVNGGTRTPRLAEEFSPASGNIFATLTFGGKCTVYEANVTGQVAAEILLDNASLGRVELGQAPEQATSWILNFPRGANIKEVWLVSNGTGKIAKLEISAFGETTLLLAQALESLANSKFEAENAVWSPLP